MERQSEDDAPSIEISENITQKPFVFLIDDEEDLLFLVESRLKRAGYNVASFLTAQEFRVAFLQKETTELVFIVTDFRLSDATGFEILAELSKSEQVVGAALQTGYCLEDIQEPKLSFPLRVFEKPVDFDELLEYISESFKKKHSKLPLV